MLKYFEDLKKGMGTDDRPYTGATILVFRQVANDGYKSLDSVSLADVLAVGASCARDLYTCQLWRDKALGNALGETIRLQSKKHLSGLHLDPAIKSAALNSRQNRESV